LGRAYAWPLESTHFSAHLKPLDAAVSASNLSIFGLAALGADQWDTIMLMTGRRWHRNPTVARFNIYAMFSALPAVQAAARHGTEDEYYRSDARQLGRARLGHRILFNTDKARHLFKANPAAAGALVAASLLMAQRRIVIHQKLLSANAGGGTKYR
jgi:hypothetical protein